MKEQFLSKIDTQPKILDQLRRASIVLLIAGIYITAYAVHALLADQRFSIGLAVLGPLLIWNYGCLWWVSRNVQRGLHAAK